MYDLGIIGGMGPESSCELYRRIIAYTDAKCDQEHISICVLNIPKTPDRTEAIVNNGLSPVPHINRAINHLINLGVKRYIVCCNTAHYFIPYLIKSNKIKNINIIDCVVNYFKNNKLKQAVILGTAGTINTGIYHKAFEKENIKIFIPDAVNINKITQIINVVKRNGAAMTYGIGLSDIIKNMTWLYPKALFVLSCTELSLLKPYLSEVTFVDPLDIVAIEAIKISGYKIK